jgi:2-isopropylmalate synthase
VEEDLNLRALLGAGIKALTIVGITWDRQVTRVLETIPEDNLTMVTDSIAYLRVKGFRVFLGAEHFVDGYRDNPEHALQTAAAAGSA